MKALKFWTSITCEKLLERITSMITKIHWVIPFFRAFSATQIYQHVIDSLQVISIWMGQCYIHHSLSVYTHLIEPNVLTKKKKNSSPAYFTQWTIAWHNFFIFCSIIVKSQDKLATLLEVSALILGDELNVCNHVTISKYVPMGS